MSRFCQSLKLVLIALGLFILFQNCGPLSKAKLTGSAGNASTSADGSDIPTPASSLPAPQILSGPLSVSVVANSEAQFQVTVPEMAETVSYQWYKNSEDNPLPGKTERILTIENAVSSDVGTYFVKVSNRTGSVTSEKATLNVSAKLAAPFGSASASNQADGWPPTLAIDGNWSTSWSSANYTQPTAYSDPSRPWPIFIQGGFSSATQIRGIWLKARMVEGKARSFPKTYKVLIQSSTGAPWVSITHDPASEVDVGLSKQPDINGNLYIPIPAVQAVGVRVETADLSDPDPNGFYYFVVTEMRAYEYY